MKNTTTNSPKIYLGADHAGFPLKEKIKRWLHKNNVSYEDLGNLKLEPTDDYPDFAESVAKSTIKHKSFGILLCGSSQGVCVAANKIKGIRAITPFSLKESRLAREHLDANIICLSGWHTHFHKATRMIEIFLTTPFSNAPRHVRRLAKIKKLESKQ